LKLNTHIHINIPNVRLELWRKICCILSYTKRLISDKYLLLYVATNLFFSPSSKYNTISTEISHEYSGHKYDDSLKQKYMIFKYLKNWEHWCSCAPNVLPPNSLVYLTSAHVDVHLGVVNVLLNLSLPQSSSSPVHPFIVVLAVLVNLLHLSHNS
jgi:hypothetical protein